MNIYVGNLSSDATESQVEQAFASFGEVKSVNIVKDRETGFSRGFGFVEMRDDQAARSAIDALNLQPIAGRAVTVNEAREPESPRRGRRRSHGASRQACS